MKTVERLFLVSVLGFSPQLGLTEDLPKQPTEAVASISQLELLLTESVCNQTSIQQQWGLSKLGCMQHLFEHNVVGACTTAHMAQVPAPDNLAMGERLTMAGFSAVYSQCLVEGYPGTS